MSLGGGGATSSDHSDLFGRAAAAEKEVLPSGRVRMERKKEEGENATDGRADADGLPWINFAIGHFAFLLHIHLLLLLSLSFPFFLRYSNRFTCAHFKVCNLRPHRQALARRRRQREGGRGWLPFVRCMTKEKKVGRFLSTIELAWSENILEDKTGAGISPWEGRSPSPRLGRR